MKITHLLAYYGNYFGGIQLSVNEVSKRQVAMGHEVKIITSDMFNRDSFIDNVPVRRLKTIFEAFRVPFVPSLPFVLGEENCDVLHVYLPLPWFDMCAALKKRMSSKVKLVVSIRNFLPNPTNVASKIAATIHDCFTVRLAIDAADAIIFTNEQFARALPYEIPKEKMFIVPNGVDTEVFRPNVDYKYRENQVLFVGRLIPEKGLEVLMRAMKLVRAKIPEIRLIAVVSDYYNQKEYLKKVLKLDDGFLEIKSGLPREELAQLYRDSTLFVLPSVGLESFGNVLLEAMASGCPVICTDLPGPAGLVKSGYAYNVGTVVPRGDVDKLAEAIINEIQKTNRERRASIAMFARSKASWDMVTKKIISIYEICGG